jgi:hypothetical protein
LRAVLNVGFERVVGDDRVTRQPDVALELEKKARRRLTAVV